MDKRVVSVLVTLNVAILIVLSGLVFVNRDNLRREYLLTYKHIPNTPQARKIMQTVESAYDIEVEAAHTFDFSKFPTVFINDPRFPVSLSTLQVVREMTDNLSLESAGYLDYKMAYYSWRREGALRLEKLEAKANAENRSLTQDEIQSLTDKYGRTAPGRTIEIKRKTPIKFLSMAIYDNISYAIIDDGPRTVELVLVLIDNRWHIAGINGISIHP